jgi:hypothetical protein
MSAVSAVLPVIAGGLLAILGSWAGIYMQTRSVRSLEDERSRRADLNLLHNDRVAAYAAFYLRIGITRRAISESLDDGTRRIDPVAIRRENWEAYVRVALIGHEGVLRAATRLMGTVDQLLFGTETYNNDAWAAEVASFVTEVRRSVIPGSQESAFAIDLLHAGNPKVNK